MIKATVRCPVQYGGEFNPEKCWECKYFDMHRGKSTSWHCRKNKDGRYKDAFTNIHVTERLSSVMEIDPVVVTIEEPETKTKNKKVTV